MPDMSSLMIDSSPERVMKTGFAEIRDISGQVDADGTVLGAAGEGTKLGDIANQLRIRRTRVDVERRLAGVGDRRLVGGARAYWTSVLPLLDAGKPYVGRA